MKILIIEDERLAATALQKLIEDIHPDVEVLGTLETIEESVEWFNTHSMPELLFLDIHLADGSSFAIFDRIDVTCPIIFTTAYDEYALKAFEVNSIDYLLKPINRTELERALNKYERLAGNRQDGDAISQMIQTLKTERKKYKSLFLIPERDKYIPLKTGDIAFIFIDTKNVKAITFDHHSYPMSQTLDELMEQLDPSDFFRANRQYIVSRQAIKDITVWFGNKLSLNLTVETPEKILVSKARVAEFKEWFS